MTKAALKLLCALNLLKIHKFTIFGIKSTQLLLIDPILTSQNSSSEPLYRIGAVSQATGIPVSTLRIWETRYAAFHPIKTPGKQRLYQEHDVSKALLLKQLSQAGHAIGAIAALELVTLRRMSSQSQQTQMRTAAPPQPVSLAVVGMHLANRLASASLAQSLQLHRIQVSAVWPDLAAATSDAQPGSAQVLLIKVNSLTPPVHAAIQTLVRKHHFAQTIVLYHFAAETVVKAMKLSGWMVRREPISDAEVAELLQSVLFVDPARAQEFGIDSAVIRPRQFSEATLSRVAGISSNVLCECPRHVAELISQLASFEEYSQECLNSTAQDAHLHAYLTSISGSARALFENALIKIAAHEGIDLRDDL